MQRGLRFIITSILVMGLLLPLVLPQTSAAKGLDRVVLQLKWKHQFQFAGYYAAEMMDFYREAGLKVELRPLTPGGSYVDEILSGRADYAVGNAYTMLRWLHGDPLVALAAIFQHSPAVLMTLRESGITSPQQFVGKRLLLSSSAMAMQMAMIRKEGVDPASVELVDYTNWSPDALEIGTCDIFGGYSTNELPQLRQQGLDLNVISPRTYGIDFYEDILFTSRHTVEEHPERTARFVAASLKGWKYAMNHPAEIIDYILGHYGTQKTREQLQWEAEAMLPLVMPKLVEIGHMNPGRWQHIADTFVELDMAKPPKDIDDFIWAPEAHALEKQQNTVNWLAGSFLVALILGLLSYAWARTLHRQVALKTRQLSESENRWRQILVNVPLFAVSLDARARIRFVNRDLLEQTGWTEDEVMGRNWFDLFIDPATSGQVKRVFLETMSRGDAGPYQNFENPIITRHGKALYVAWFNMVLKDEAGNVSEVVCLGADLTERKRALDTLRESQEDLRKVIEHTPIPMAIQDDDGTVRYLNKAFEQQFGYTIRDIPDLETTFRKAYPDPEYRTHVAKQWEEAVGAATGTLIEGGQYRIIDIWGKESIMDIRGMRLDRRMILTYQDVTALMQAEELMRVARDKAETANLSKSEFLANMSHELRTPLNGILGMLQLLRISRLDKEQQEYAEHAINSGDRLNRLLSDILDISAVEAGKLQLHPARVNLHDLMRSVETLLGLTARSKEIRLECFIDARLPDVVVSDETRLRQILLNLAGNGLKFTQSGTVTISLMALAPWKQGCGGMLISVADTGPGIDYADLTTAFDKFGQICQGFTRTHQGAGLGLPIVKRLTRLLGGSICVDSTPGAGATFHVSLPFLELLEAPEETPSVAVDEKPQPDTSRDTTLPKRVLVAEDDTLSSFLVVKMLAKLDVEVCSVENGIQAIEALQETSFDAVLMDIQMPEMNGLEATRRIRDGEAGDANRDIPIIAMTAYVMKGDRETFLASGMDEYLAKPLDMDDMLNILQTQMARRI